MSNKIVVPTLGESITEATVAKWLKNKGDKVNSDEPLVELETDKVNVEVPSPMSGILDSISANEGDTVNVGALLGTVGSSKVSKTEKEYSPPEPKKELKKISSKETLILGVETNKNKSTSKKVDKSNGKQLSDMPLVLTEEIDGEDKIKNIKTDKVNYKKDVSISPAARKLAKESNINLEQVKGSGRKGLILKEDILGLMGHRPDPSERKINYGPEERVKMTRLRMTIAKRLKEAQENAAMLTTFNEVDMNEVIAMRSQYKDEFQKKYSVKLGFMSFFVKACVIGLKNYPAVNAEIQGDEIIYKNYYNISIAVGTDRGLVVPVIKKTDEMSFADIEKNISDLGQKARDGKITIEDLQGGTFTITNGGIYGSMLSTPILNPPQSAVLGMHNIVERPMNISGEVKIRPVMYLALSYDHRIIDGKEAVSFLKTVKECLEQPKRLFLNL